MIDFNHMMASVGDAAADPVTPSPRLVKASHEFEASLLQQLLKPMQEQSGMFKDDGDDDDDNSSDSESSLREYGAEVMAGALSERGGLGLSKMVLTKLAPIEAAQEKQKSTGFRKS
jgi:Rod binding domain-containing protein